MTLDQALATASDIPAVFLDPDRRRAELHGDVLAALSDGSAQTPGGGRADTYAVVTRPTILRRVAALAADALPEHLDRLVTSEPEGLALTVAVALHTGLPYTVIRDHAGQSPQLGGEIHRGERVAVLETAVTTGTQALRIAGLAEEHGARVAGILAVLDHGRGAEAALAEAGHELQALLPPTSPRY